MVKKLFLPILTLVGLTSCGSLFDFSVFPTNLNFNLEEIKIDYDLNERFTSDGLKVTASFEDKEDVEYKNFDLDSSDFDSSKEGIYGIMVTVSGDNWSYGESYPVYVYDHSGNWTQENLDLMENNWGPDIKIPFYNVKKYTLESNENKDIIFTASESNGYSSIFYSRVLINNGFDVDINLEDVIIYANKKINNDASLNLKIDPQNDGFICTIKCPD